MDQHFNKMTSGILAIKGALHERVAIVEVSGPKTKTIRERARDTFLKT